MEGFKKNQKIGFKIFKKWVQRGKRQKEYSI
jgi:hypothetical protein